ncbi:MAG: prepilin peptidase [SAR324 cluster bacterium]|nr:prepilin peptidase [SAR324 cluster bacterium]
MQVDNIVLYVFIITFGLFLGSFGYSLFLRIPADISLLKSSYCPNCKQRLKFYSLIPIFSYLFLRGKCHSCSVSIGKEYLLWELGGAMLAVVVFLKSTSLLEFFLWYMIWFLLFVNSLIDLKHYWLSSYLMLAGLVFGISQLLIFRRFELVDSVIGMLGGAGAFYFIRFIHNSLRQKEALGEGDVTLFGIIGLSLTWQSLVIISYLSAGSAIVAILLLGLINKRALNQPLPFAIFIIGASFLVWFFPGLNNLFFDLYASNS